MLQSHSDFFFDQPMIYFGSFHQVADDDDEEDEIFYPFVLDIDPRYPLRQDTGLHLRWPNS